MGGFFLERCGWVFFSGKVWVGGFFSGKVWVGGFFFWKGVGGWFFSGKVWVGGFFLERCGWVVCFWKGVGGCFFCVGRDIVQADHAPGGGVAQGIFHGILVRHHGRNQEEVEEGLEEEVEGQEEENV